MHANCICKGKGELKRGALCRQVTHLELQLASRTRFSTGKFRFCSIKAHLVGRKREIYCGPKCKLYQSTTTASRSLNIFSLVPHMLAVHRAQPKTSNNNKALWKSKYLVGQVIKMKRIQLQSYMAAKIIKQVASVMNQVHIGPPSLSTISVGL